MRKNLKQLVAVLVAATLVSSLTPVSGVMAEAIEGMMTDDQEEFSEWEGEFEVPLDDISEESVLEMEETSGPETVLENSSSMSENEVVGEPEDAVSQNEASDEVSDEEVSEETVSKDVAPETAEEAENAVSENAVEETEKVLETEGLEETETFETTNIVSENTVSQNDAEAMKAAEPEETLQEEATEVAENLSETGIADAVHLSQDDVVSENGLIAASESSQKKLANGEKAGWCEPLDLHEPESFSEVRGMSSETSLMTANLNTVSVTYYQQPEFYAATDYDAVTAYITDVSGNYVARCFFITDGADWLLYDYGETMAKTFFTATELKDGKYIPTQKAASRKDNSATSGIDESKIPTLSQESYDAITYDWRSLDNVPFTRGSSGIVYASKVSQGGSGDDPVNPDPTPDPSQLNTYVVTVNTATYKIELTKEVAYTGKKHVLATAKATKKQSADVHLTVYRNNSVLEPELYSVKFYNNTNVTGYSKESAIPFVVITLKNVAPYKKDRSLLLKKAFPFDIVPVNIGSLGFTAKKVRVTTDAKTGAVKVSLNTPKVKIGDITVKLSPQGAKNPRTGSYTLGSYTEGILTLNGVNNFNGSLKINLLSAKTMDYVF